MANFSKMQNKSNEGIWVNIDDVNGLPIEGVRIKVLGIDSDAYKNQQRKITDRRLSNRKMKITSAELESEGLSLLVACVVAWEGIEDDNGNIECTASNVRQFLLENPFVREQLDSAIADRANFIGNFKND